MSDARVFQPMFSPAQQLALLSVKAALLEQGRPLSQIPAGLEPAPAPLPVVDTRDERSR